MERFTTATAQAGDLMEIKAIEVECGLSPWSLSAYESELERPDAILLIARTEAGEPVGFIVGTVPAAGARSQSEIHNIGTKKAYRGQGIGSMLIEQFRSACISRGVSTVWLEVRETNLTAINFYGSHGFVRDGIRRNFYSNPEEDAVLMSLRLGPERPLTKS